MKNTGLVLLAAALLLSGCKGGKYAASEKVYEQKAAAFAKTITAQPAENQWEKVPVIDKEWVASVNFGTRKPNYVMIHHTAQKSVNETIRTFQLERTQVSAHYVVGRNGKVVQMVNDYFRAHHAGAGLWGNDTDLNSSSIGIELDNNGTTDPWPEAQISALIQLLTKLKENYKIPQANFIGHMDFAPSRKPDPANFPWDRLAQAGFGFWYDANLQPAPHDFDVHVALRIIGYDIKNLDAAIKGFKRHYIPQNANDTTFNEQERAILYNIYMKYLYL
ncbi:N-acetylmuramoyl-L-alanine amidase [Sphingobacterium corticibacter]|uniref:N-acetylmuramoyl-L-alanine amidase n=1 Tax=Sphingobacterium corticibacter TaxID=2171749 RepID=A0A2T8HK21_9SPHI|nr:N-acetylmuramoyl-L-alanine amidase [Sphingobacterium corticibacter]PVH25794.1 N-acetylmuramoyl-L-alanine amidase [Sphingobacterium corticibacter]